MELTESTFYDWHSIYRRRKGRQNRGVIDLKKHRALREDFEDVLTSRSRRHEKRVPWDKVKADLIKSGKLRS